MPAEAVVADALFLDSFLLLSFLDNHRLDYLFLRRGGGGGGTGEPSPVLGASRKKSTTSLLEKLAQLDPKLGHLELPGPTAGRKVERKLCVNASQVCGITLYCIAVSRNINTVKNTYVHTGIKYICSLFIATGSMSSSVLTKPVSCCHKLYKLNCNLLFRSMHKDLVMSWWRGGYLSDSSWGLNTAGVAGVEASRDRANLVLLGIIGSKLDILCFIHTPGK